VSAGLTMRASEVGDGFPSNQDTELTTSVNRLSTAAVDQPEYGILY
jgi:hypothetical protein